MYKFLLAFLGCFLAFSFFGIASTHEPILKDVSWNKILVTYVPPVVDETEEAEEKN